MTGIIQKYEPVIGLEIHAQMNTASKAFCECSTDFHSSPNTNICPVCLGYPGALPVLNEKLVEYVLKIGLASNCKIREQSIFARKNYFYPDLTKGYQITQYETPICHDGYINIKPKGKASKKIGITRIHMEEDAGKSIHDFHDDNSLIDFNRCGVPLIEIVSEPDISSPEEAVTYIQKVRQTLIYLGINDGNMEEGSLRCDANISVKPVNSDKLGTRTEIKNLNSFKNVFDALKAEITRQITLLESGQKVEYHTMTYNAKDKTTAATRSKEEAHDYRYFPEPDLVKVYITKDRINEIRQSLPELPDDKKLRYMRDYNLTEAEAEELTVEKEFSEYYEKVISRLKSCNEKTYKASANILRTDVRKVLNEDKIGISEFIIFPGIIAGLAESIVSGQISSSASREIFNEILNGKSEIEQDSILQESLKRYSQVSNEIEIESLVRKILDENDEEVKRYKIGEKKLAGFFIGKIMQESKGKANPKIVNELLIKLLED